MTPNTLRLFVDAVAQAHTNTPQASDTLVLDRKLTVEAARRVGKAIKRVRKAKLSAGVKGGGKRRGPKIKYTDRGHELQRERMALHREIRRENEAKKEPP